jgi:hypothetical protein
MRKGLAIIGSGLLSLHAAAQNKPSAAIPATAPTQSVSDLPSAHPPTAAPASRGKSKVTWTGAELTIDAGGDSLPDILRQIAVATGMKITGGVPDERVFGIYGPSSVQAIMAQLFDGLSINMMLVNGTETVPKTLVLTTRSGAASPPSTRQVSVSEEDRLPMRRGGFNQPAGPPQQSFGPPPQPPAGSTPGFQPPNTPDNASDSGSAGVPNDSDQQPGARTPEQIFEELKRRQQQQSSAP